LAVIRNLIFPDPRGRGVEVAIGNEHEEKKDMKRTTLAIFASLLTMASTSFAATQAANAATVAPQLNVSATIQKAVSLTLSVGATAGVTHCAVASTGATPEYTMDFGAVDAMAIGAGNCVNRFAPATPGVSDAIYWSDYQLLPVYTSHQTFSGTTVTAKVLTDFAAPNNLYVVRDTSNSNAATVATPTAVGNFVALSTTAQDTIGAAGVASGTALTRFIGVGVKPLNANNVGYASQTATVTFTLTVQ
jgi:hypothetical protein